MKKFKYLHLISIYSDSAFNDMNGVNGDDSVPSTYTKPGPACSKRKRKSLAEKFLEDNDNYYGIQVCNKV